MAVADTIFPAERHHQLGQSLSVFFGQESVIGIACAIEIDESREVLLKERQENSCRAGLEKEWIGVDVLGTRFTGRFHQRFKITGPIRYFWEYGSAEHPGIDAGEIQLTDSLQAEIGAWRSWFKFAREIDVDGSHGEIHKDLIALTDTPKNFCIACDEV